MATIFLVMIGVALGGLLIAFGTGLSAFGALDPERLDAHRNLAFACAIAVVFVHSLVFVYLIGTAGPSRTPSASSRSMASCTRSTSATSGAPRPGH